MFADGDAVTANDAQWQVDASQGRHEFGIRTGCDHHDGRGERAVVFNDAGPDMFDQMA